MYDVIERLGFGTYIDGIKYNVSKVNTFQKCTLRVPG